MSEITLNDAEQKLCKYLAKVRYENNRSLGVENRKIGTQSNEETDLNGIGAEIAFCKIFNLYPDMTTEFPYPDSDAITHSGINVDVKTTKYQSGHLIAVTWKFGNSTDGYVLMVGEFPKYRFAGFSWSEDLLKPDNIKDFGYGSTYALSQDRLFELP